MIILATGFRWDEVWIWLRERLARGGMSEWRQEERRRKWLAILLSVLIAFLLWFTFNMRETYSVIIEMPMEIMDLPEDVALEAVPAAVARVNLQGQGWQLLQLYYRPQRLPVSVPEAGEEIDLLESAAVLSLPGGVGVQNVSPRTIRVQTGPRTSRRVPIEVNAELRPAPTYDFIRPLEIEPDSVTISGAESLVNEIDAWPTDFLELANVRNTFTAEVPLSDTLRNLISLDIQSVRVSGELEVFTEGSREVRVAVRGAPTETETVLLYPSRVRVIYRVPLSQFERASEDPAFLASVGYEEILEDTTGTVAPEIEVPDELVLRDLRVEPRRLQYFTLID